MTCSCKSFIDGDVDRSELGAFHTGEGKQMARIVHDGDVHWYVDFF